GQIDAIATPPSDCRGSVANIDSRKIRFRSGGEILEIGLSAGNVGSDMHASCSSARKLPFHNTKSASWDHVGCTARAAAKIGREFVFLKPVSSYICTQA